MAVVSDVATCGSDYERRLRYTVTISERQSSLGITHAIWMYANAPCMKDPWCDCPTAADIRQDSAHRAANGKKYEIAKGLFVDGKWTWPGVEEGCKCCSRPVLPWSGE